MKTFTAPPNIISRMWLIMASLSLSSATSSHGAEPLARIPVTFARNQVRVPVSINGSQPFILILDTGMPTRGVLLWQSERVDALGLEFPGSEPIHGAGSGGAVAARVATSEFIELGGYRIKQTPIIVLQASTGLPQDVDGVIGVELFDQFVVRVDVDHKHIELIDPSTFTPPKGSSSVPLRFRERMAFVDARVTLSGKPVDADLAVDLGAGHALWLNDGSNPSLASPTGAMEIMLGRGVSGPIHGSIGRVQRVEIGDVAFENVLAVFPTSEFQNPGGVDFEDGFVGAELLTRFVVTFDYPSERMLLERGARFAEPFEYNMTGMVFDPGGPTRFRVDSVLPNSPAAAAGVAEGDILVAVDGQSPTALGDDGLERAFQRDGAEVTVTLERGSERIEKRLRLRRLL